MRHALITLATSPLPMRCAEGAAKHGPHELRMFLYNILCFVSLIALSDEVAVRYPLVT
jgi:hypothetical protein